MFLVWSDFESGESQPKNIKPHTVHLCVLAKHPWSIFSGVALKLSRGCWKNFRWFQPLSSKILWPSLTIIMNNKETLIVIHLFDNKYIEFSFFKFNAKKFFTFIFKTSTSLQKSLEFFCKNYKFAKEYMKVRILSIDWPFW